MFSRIWPAILLVAFPAVALAANTSAPSVSVPSLRSTSLGPTTLEQRELHLSKSLARASQFANIAHISSRPSCEDVQPPEALATPDPLFALGQHGKKVKVSFIIGTDGRVHSPLILESAGLAGDRHVLQTVRTWRYRPATCNGVPTETEGKIEFSGR
ncbi:MAG TPA: energy transducer TonB [Terriglobales bacterium]|nr:energy transducer TonB [Terriglobales bacterium]